MEKNNSVRESILRRRSRRSFLSTPVSEADIALIVDSARLAPSGSNSQPAYLVQVDDPELRKKICQHTGYKGAEEKPRRQSFILSAPLLFAVVTEIENERRLQKWNSAIPIIENRERYLVAAIRDGAIVADHLVLQATDLGLASCFMSWFPQEEVKEILQIPRHHYIVTFVAIGHAAHGYVPAQERKPLEKFLYLNQYVGPNAE